MWSATFSAPAPSRPGITTAISWPGAKACVTRRASVLAMPLIMGSTRHVRIRKECDSYLYLLRGCISAHLGLGEVSCEERAPSSRRTRRLVPSQAAEYLLSPKHPPVIDCGRLDLARIQIPVLEYLELRGGELEESSRKGLEFRDRACEEPRWGRDGGEVREGEGLPPSIRRVDPCVRLRRDGPPQEPEGDRHFGVGRHHAAHRVNRAKGPSGHSDGS